MKYKKGSFLVVPNLQIIEGQPSAVQSVYFWICSFANEDGNCFPSHTIIAQKSGVSTRTVIRSIEILETLGVLKKEVRMKNNEKISNLYQLLIKVSSDTMSVPSDTMSVPPSDTMAHRTIPTLFNKTNLTGEIVISQAKEIDKIIDLFKAVNPNFDKLFRNKTQREATERLIKKWGMAKVEGMVIALPEIIAKPYAPRITTPWDLEKDLAKLIAFVKQEKNKTNAFSEKVAFHA